MNTETPGNFRSEPSTTTPATGIAARGLMVMVELPVRPAALPVRVAVVAEATAAGGVKLVVVPFDG